MTKFLKSFIRMVQGYMPLLLRFSVKLLVFVFYEMNW